MFDKLKKLGEKAKEVTSSAAVLVGDLNGDGKVDEVDARIAAEWTKKTTSSFADEVGRLGKEALRSDMAKDAAAGAAVGAAVAVPVPVIGPLAGAAIGAGVGVYKNLTKKQSGNTVSGSSGTSQDTHTELLKLADLHQKGILTDAEFEAEKKKLLGDRV